MQLLELFKRNKLLLNIAGLSFPFIKGIQMLQIEGLLEKNIGSGSVTYVA